PQTSTSSATSVTMVITTNNNYNNTVGAQPAYYLLVNGTLEAATVIQLPAFQKITFTIINYDNGTAYPLGEPGTNVSTGAGPQSFYQVAGTVGNVEKVINDTNVNSTKTVNSNGINVSGGEVLSSISLYNVSHTFTVSSLGINIPIPPSSTVVFTLYLTQTGSYLWQCEAPCGSGPTGWDAAMATVGWMTGTFEVYS
ncbi:MAG: hypothetical protein QW812_05505, partial [Thermoplasmataceae archaeon]